MTKLIPIQFDENTIIYIEATEDVDVPSVPTETGGARQGSKGAVSDSVKKQSMESFAAIQSTIYTYTALTLNAFKKVAIANVNKVTLEFGIEIGGEAGVPYVTKGTAKSNLKITVECSFPDKNEPQTETK
ncbi:MAG: CU044_2847 family protein [Coleofasciculaceae cyanobacterium]